MSDEYFDVVCRRNVRTPPGSKPGLTCLQLPQRTQHQPRADAEHAASPIWTATSAPSALRRAMVSVLWVWRRSGCSSGRDRTAIGISAKSIATATVMLSTAANTTASSAISFCRGISGGMRAASTGNEQPRQQRGQPARRRTRAPPARPPAVGRAATATHRVPCAARSPLRARSSGSASACRG